MLAWLSRWLRPRTGPPPGPRKRPCSCRLQVEELESRLTPRAGGTVGLNTPITTDPGVQQMPSIAADPHDPSHLVVAYMDYSLLHTGYAGLGVAVSHDAGSTWQQPTAVPMPTVFDQGVATPIDQGAATPIAHFDDQGHV